MRRLLLLLLVLAACSEDEGRKAAPAPEAHELESLPATEAAAPLAEAPAPTVTVTPAQAPAGSASPPATAGAPALAPGRGSAQAPAAAPSAAAPAPTETPAPTDGRVVRRYERLVNGRREAAMRVEWTPVERDGRRLVEDVTETRSRALRDMAGVKEKFESESISRTLRTENGELISMETVVTTPMRVDKEKVERTPAGYRVTVSAGPNEETFAIASEGPAMVDPEAFLAARIRRGEVEPGATFRVPVLDTGRRRVAEATLTVAGPDDEGPGLKVVQSLDGEDTLWWFAEDGSVVRLRSGIMVIRRDDTVDLEDLPKRLASVRVTLPSNVDLPRIFTTRSMTVDIVVKTDETTKPPQIPPNPFTQVVERTGDTVTVLLNTHDDPAATCPLPIDPKGFEEHLKPTRLMEVDDPDVRRLARRIVSGAEDAREAARRIADHVFTRLSKGSPAIPEPTMKEILRDGLGDCSEHALLFTGLCRAAGIPARRCSGWVCIGGDWGTHSWCEVWVGRWIGADPTTNEIGTRARYVLLARPDEPDVAPGRITTERTRMVIRRAEYVDGAVDVDADEPDREVYSGIRLGTVPEGWKVDRNLRSVRVEGPGFFAVASLRPDHGYRSMDLLVQQMPGGEEGRFGGRPAAVGRAFHCWAVPLGREILTVTARPRGGGAVPEEEIAKLLSPTLEREG